MHWLSSASAWVWPSEALSESRVSGSIRVVVWSWEPAPLETVKTVGGQSMGIISRPELTRIGWWLRNGPSGGSLMSRLRERCRQLATWDGWIDREHQWERWIAGAERLVWYQSCCLRPIVWDLRLAPVRDLVACRMVSWLMGITPILEFTSCLT